MILFHLIMIQILSIKNENFNYDHSNFTTFSFILCGTYFSNTLNLKKQKQKKDVNFLIKSYKVPYSTLFYPTTFHVQIPDECLHI